MGLTGYEPEFAPFTTPAGRARTFQLAQRAVMDGKFLDIFFHEIQPGQEADFREMMRMLKPLKASIQPFHVLFPAPAPALVSN